MDWNTLYAWLTEQVTANQFFAGGIVMGLVGYLAMIARTWPSAAAMFLGRQLMTELVIRSTDGEAFMHVALWLAKHKSRAKARRLGLIDYWDNDDDDPDSDYEVTFGFGSHMLWEGFLPILVTRSMAESSTPGAMPVQELKIRMVGRTHDRVLKLINDAKVSAKASTKVGIYVWSSGYYQTIDRREPRPAESIIMPAKDKADLIGDLTAFKMGREWYRDRGLPWRRGYLLEGPPGTGKSSTIFAMAGVVRKGIYIINPATVMNDNELLTAFASAGDGIVVIEDIDAIEITAARETGKTTKDKERERKGITLSGLLNAIDGVTARDGRILFITSNHPDKLDPALLRAGRVDKRVYLDLLTRELGAEMFDRFFPGECPDAFLDTISWPCAPAEVQGRLLKWETSTVVSLDTAKPVVHIEPAGGTLAGDVA